MANEKRLVNAEAIARKIKNAHCIECNVVRKVQCSACWVEDVLELLEGEAVEAVEMVHGRWEADFEYEDFRHAHCSICGEISEYMYKYCPNCGAKMDGGNEDV